jgi:hypothetical protein
MRLPIEVEPSVTALPPGRLLLVGTTAAILAVADVLPANPYVDPDLLEFTLTVALGLLALGFSVRDRVAGRVLREWGIRALLSLCAGVVALLAAEPVTRYLFRDVTTTADNGGFFSRRWYRTGAVRRNSAGFREREFQNAKPSGIYRIAVVGDSFTFGNGIRQEDRYSDLLRVRLPTHFEVLNFGTPGANTPEHRNLIGELLPRIHPDFVLLQWYVNDMEDDDVTGRPTSQPLMPRRLLHEWLSMNSALYTLANSQWTEAQISFGWTPAYSEYLRRRLGADEGRDARIDRDLLRDLIATCRKRGVPLGIVLFPDTTADLGSRYPFGYLHERVLGVCQEHGLICVDLRADFSRVKDRRTLWANRLDHHPSALANEIAAVKIFETYSRQWAAPPQGNAAH